MVVGLKVGKPFDTKVLANVHFKGYMGVKHEQFDFTLADLPMMNPYNWIILLNIVSPDPMKYESIFKFLRRMIRGYIQEVSKMHGKIRELFNPRPILKPMEQLDDVESFKVGFIQKKPWGVVYKTSMNHEMKNCIMFFER